MLKLWRLWLARRPDLDKMCYYTCKILRNTKARLQDKTIKKGKPMSKHPARQIGDSRVSRVWRKGDFFGAFCDTSFGAISGVVSNVAAGAVLLLSLTLPLSAEPSSPSSADSRAQELATPESPYTPEQREEIESSLQNRQDYPSQDHQSQDESFITPQEYGTNLYENPRGIGCVKCHGRDGEENLLASYMHKGKQKHIIVPRINNLSFPAFKIALSKDNGVMPRYNLTDDEINAIYLYITSRNKTFQ